MPIHQVPFPYFYPGAKMHSSAAANPHHSTAAACRERDAKEMSESIDPSPPLNYSSRRDVVGRMENQRNGGSGQHTPETSEEEHEESVNVEID